MKIDGECHCGEIAFEAELDPDKVVICHCVDCQILSGTAYRTIAIVAGDTFRLTRGTPKQYVKVAESGNRRRQAFCANCGTGLYASSDEDQPAAYNVRVGTLRQRADIVPRSEVWRQSVLSWLPQNDATKKFEKGIT